MDRSQSYPGAAGAWIGRWDLTSDGVPVPTGLYALVVETPLGTFQAEIQVVAPGAAPAGWGKAEAPVWGVGLRVCRLVEEGDGPPVSLRVGEYLLVALPGNPTPGYDWEVTEAPAFLSPVVGPGYRPFSGLIGGGERSTGGTRPWLQAKGP